MTPSYESQRTDPLLILHDFVLKQDVQFLKSQGICELYPTGAVMIGNWGITKTLYFAEMKGGDVYMAIPTIFMDGFCSSIGKSLSAVIPESLYKYIAMVWQIRASYKKDMKQSGFSITAIDMQPEVKKENIKEMKKNWSDLMVKEQTVKEQLARYAQDNLIKLYDKEVVN